MPWCEYLAVVDKVLFDQCAQQQTVLDVLTIAQNHLCIHHNVVHHGGEVDRRMIDNVQRSAGLGDTFQLLDRLLHFEVIELVLSLLVHFACKSFILFSCHRGGVGIVAVGGGSRRARTASRRFATAIFALSIVQQIANSINLVQNLIRLKRSEQQMQVIRLVDVAGTLLLGEWPVDGVTDEIELVGNVGEYLARALLVAFGPALLHKVLVKLLHRRAANVSVELHQQLVDGNNLDERCLDVVDDGQKEVDVARLDLCECGFIESYSKSKVRLYSLSIVFLTSSAKISVWL